MHIEILPFVLFMNLLMQFCVVNLMIKNMWLLGKPCLYMSASGDAHVAYMHSR